MKTWFTHKDLAIKSDSIDELIELALEYSGDKTGLRNELNRQLAKCKKEGIQSGTKSNFVAGYDRMRKEYFLVIKDQYEPAYLLTMLYELATEVNFFGAIEDEIQVRSSQITDYLSEIEKNEELNLGSEKEQLTSLVYQFIQMLKLYENEDDMSEEEMERLSSKFDQLFYKPISDIIEGILKQLKSGNISIKVDTGDFPLPE